MNNLRNRDTKLITKTHVGSNGGLNTFHFFVIASSILMIVVFSSIFLLDIEKHSRIGAFYSTEDIRSYTDLCERNEKFLKKQAKTSR